MAKDDPYCGCADTYEGYKSYTGILVAEVPKTKYEKWKTLGRNGSQAGTESEISKMRLAPEVKAHKDEE